MAASAAKQPDQATLVWPTLSAAGAVLEHKSEPSPERREKISKLFQEIDRNGDGHLNADELQSALKQLGLPYSVDYVNELLRQYDTNSDGYVDAKEFHNYIVDNEDFIERAFKQLDLDGGGDVCEEELLASMRRMGLPASPDDAKRMVQLLDRDGDGGIDYEAQFNVQEFRRFVVLLPRNQLSQGGIVTSWIDSADWMAGIEYRLSMTPPTQWRERLLAGGLAGAVSRTAVAPLERLRTMMMADAANKSIVGTMQKMWADGGALGLFKGNLATVAKVIPQSAIQMAAFDQVKDVLQSMSPGEKLTNSQRLVAGITAGAASVITTYPMENLRTHVSLGRRGGYLKILSDIYQYQGFKGVYGGFGPALINTVSTAGMGFLSYEIGCDIFRNHIAQTPRAPTPGERGIIAGCSAISVMAATMPLEVVTRRMQVQGSPGHPQKYATMFECFKIMAREEGPRSFYRGTISSFMKVVPSIAIVRYLYEAINQVSGTSGIRQYRSGLPATKAAGKKDSS